MGIPKLAEGSCLFSKTPLLVTPHPQYRDSIIREALPGEALLSHYTSFFLLPSASELLTCEQRGSWPRHQLRGCEGCRLDCSQLWRNKHGQKGCTLPSCPEAPFSPHVLIPLSCQPYLLGLTEGTRAVRGWVKESPPPGSSCCCCDNCKSGQTEFLKQQQQKVTRDIHG